MPDDEFVTYETLDDCRIARILLNRPEARNAQNRQMTALLIEESVNQTVDDMGFHNSLNACVTLHELNHAHWAELNGDRWAAAREDDGIPSWREAPPIVPAVKDQVRADG